MRYKRNEVIGRPFCDKEPIIHTNDKLIEKRELLKIELKKNGDKSVAIIMMNPSKADSFQSDGTVNKIIKYFLKPYIRPLNEKYRRIDDIKFLNILNLLPIYNSNSIGLENDINSIISVHGYDYLEFLLKSNIQKINDVINESDYVVLAWGMPEKFPLTLYFEQAAKVLEELIIIDKDIFVFRVRNSRARYHLTKHLNPPHPSRCVLLRLVRVDIKRFYNIVPRFF